MKYHFFFLKITFFLVFLLPICTITQTLFPFSINSVCAGLIILFSFLTIISNKKINKINFSLAISMFMLYIINIVVGKFDFISANIEGGFWWILLALLFTIIFDNDCNVQMYNTFIKNYKSIYLMCILFVFFVTICLFNNNCYVYIQGWSGTYFLAYARTPHVMCTTICAYTFIILYLVFINKINKFNLIFIVPLLYAVLQSGARTFLVAYMLILLMYITLMYKFSLKEVIILCTLGLFFLIILKNSSMLDKISSRKDFSTNTDTKNVLSIITSGRSIFWVEKIKSYLDFSLINKFFGGGFGCVDTIKLSYTSAVIDAHNDIINILIDEGIMGLIIYLFILIYFFKNRMKNIPFLPKILFILTYFFTAFFTRYLTYVSLFSTWFIISFIDRYININNLVINKKGEKN